MRRFETMSYSQKVKWRTRGLWLVLFAMLVYMVVIGETGGGDSRVMDRLASTFSRVVFFGGLFYVIFRIVRNKKLLKNRMLLKEQMRQELDERNQYLHDKSGGVVLDILLVWTLFVSLTASLYHMAAFYTSAGILAAEILLKAGAYWWYSRGQ